MMSRFVIVNGDDFGVSQGVNQAIIEAHQRGILTSTSLMVTGDAFEEAVALAKAYPSLAVGLHLVLCCGKSALPPQQISHLVDAQGNFSGDPVKAGLRYQFNPAARRELGLEIRAQLEKFHQTGLPLSHVDGHLHLHTHPVVLRSLSELAAEFAIRVIRLPYEELSFTFNLDRRRWLTKIIWSFVFGRLHGYGEGLLKAQGIEVAERVYGLLQTGNMTEDYLLGLIPQIRANLVEIYAHPAIPMAGEPGHGSVESGKRELNALLSEQVRDVLVSCGFQLSNYNQLRAAGLL
jgi:hopanoid biosynthesis associated protein HpnK